MSEKKKNEIEKNLSILPPEEISALKKDYRKLVADALRTAKNYRGAEQESEDVIAHLEKVDQWMRENIGSGKPLTLQQEKQLNDIFHTPERDRSIQGILDFTHEHFDKWMERSAGLENAKRTLENLKILTIELDGIVLPPGKGHIVSGGGKGTFEKGPLAPRLSELITLLNNNEIYTDDIIVCHGAVLAGAMRDETYYLVEIPRLNKQVLVCNQIGEATFVINGIINRETLLRLSKDELQDQFEDKVIKITYSNKPYWDRKLHEALFQPPSAATDAPIRGQKIDVRDAEAVRNEIKKYYGAGEWIQLNELEKRSFEIDGAKMSAIASLFGIHKNPFNFTNQLELAARIFGEDDPELKEVLETERHNRKMQLELGDDLDKWKNHIKSEYTEEQWINMLRKEQIHIRFYGLSLHELAIKFRIKKYEHTKIKFLEFGLIIFGEENSKLKQLYEEEKENIANKLALGKNPDKWRKAIMEKYTAKEWLTLVLNYSKPFFFHGVSITAIANIFIRGADFTYVPKNELLRLSKIIYGKNNPAFLPSLDDKRIKQFELAKNIKVWKRAIKSLYSAKEWMELKHSEISKINVLGSKIKAIASKFGIKGGYTKLVHYELGGKIYGEKHPAVKDILETGRRNNAKQKELGNDPNKWREEIKKKYSPDDWLNMTSITDRDFEIHGAKITAIAKIFGMKKFKISVNINRLQLGALIYEDNAAINAKIAELTGEQEAA